MLATFKALLASTNNLQLMAQSIEEAKTEIEVFHKARKIRQAVNEIEENCSPPNRLLLRCCVKMTSWTGSFCD
jgi:hypothetical protein